MSKSIKFEIEFSDGLLEYITDYQTRLEEIKAERYNKPSFLSELNSLVDKFISYNNKPTWSFSKTKTTPKEEPKKESYDEESNDETEDLTSTDTSKNTHREFFENFLTTLMSDNGFKFNM